MATLSSGYTSTEPISISNAGVWSFVAPENSSIRMTNVRVLQPLEENIDEAIGIFEPLGGDHKIAVSSAVYGVDGTYEIICQGETEWASVKALLQYQGTLYVQDPLGNQKYVRFTTRNTIIKGKITSLIRNSKIGYIEVGAP